MREAILKNTIKFCCVVFCVLIIAHAFEAIVLRMDESLFGENFINKLFGVFVLWIALKALQWKWSDIGFHSNHLARNIAFGFTLAAATFFIAYLVEISILSSRGESARLGFFIMAFSLTGEAEIRRGAGFILMCVIFNIINVLMEEGTFRGLFYRIIRTDHSGKSAMLIQALLFGIWHVVTPLHNLIDGDLTPVSFIGLSIGYILLAGMMGIKWLLMYQLTGSLYAGMTDHFFNNCIATNLLHLTTESGTDELMVIRVVIAQLLSFIVVTVIWMKTHKRSKSVKRQIEV